ncbi:MAG: hypothetical protein U1B30_05805 [Pseudomonadota bacterium]|nr:hypothetical protein [Pseudomonadota bacterium]
MKLAQRLMSGSCSLALLMALLFSAAAGAEGRERRVVDNSDVVKQWCEKKSHDHFMAKKITPYNWSASWWDEENAIVVKGEWRVEQGKVRVSCRAERGQTLKHAVMTLEYETQP